MKKLLPLIMVSAILLMSGCIKYTPQEKVETTTTTVAEVAEPTTTTQPPTLCPGQLLTSLELQTFNLDTEDPFDLLEVDYRIFDLQTGKYAGKQGSTSDSDVVEEDVSCGYNYIVYYYDDDHAGTDIYPYTEEMMAEGPAVTASEGARVQGELDVVIYDTTGTESDQTIVMGTGQKYTQVKVKVSESTGNSVQDIVLLFDYDTAVFQSVKVPAVTMLSGVPTTFNTYEAAYDTGDSLRNYGNRYYDVVVEAMNGVDPSGETITVKAVDKCGYWKTVGAGSGNFQWPIPNSVEGMQNDVGEDVGLTGAAQGESSLTVN
jgi:hypothetical protein